jgi:hypothetical protein
MQQQLDDLVKERARSRKSQVLGRSNSHVYVEQNSETEVDSSDLEDQAKTKVQKNAKRKDSSLKTRGARNLRPKKQRIG